MAKKRELYSTRIWLTPWKYVDKSVNGSWCSIIELLGFDPFHIDDCIKLSFKDSLKNRYYYRHKGTYISKEEYDAYWKPYKIKRALIRAIKEFK